MLDDIHTCLDALKLRKTREILQAELKLAQAKKSSYSAFLLSLLRQEHEDKRQRSIASRIKQSGLQDRWSLDTYPWNIQTCVSKKQHYELAELDFIARAENIVWMGGTGVGKTGLAESILLKALYAGRTGRMVKAQDLSMSSTTASPTAQPRRCSSAFRAWTCSSSMSWATSSPSRARSTTSSASSRTATARGQRCSLQIWAIKNGRSSWATGRWPRRCCGACCITATPSRSPRAST